MIVIVNVTLILSVSDRVWTSTFVCDFVIDFDVIVVWGYDFDFDFDCVIVENDVNLVHVNAIGSFDVDQHYDYAIGNVIDYHFVDDHGMVNVDVEVYVIVTRDRYHRELVLKHRV